MSAGVFYSNTNAATLTNVGTSGQVLTSNGSGSAPSFQNAASGGITTIDGDSGSVTGSTIHLLAKTGSANCGATVLFKSSSATELDLVVSNSSQSTILGSSSGNGSFTGTNNTGFGSFIFQSLTSGNYNVGVGYGSLNAVTSGSSNTSLGNGCLVSLLTGSNNVGIGAYNGTFNTGGNYTSSESSNIIISNIGVASENNTIRIGTQGSGDGEQNICYIAGITGATPDTGSTPQVVLCDSNGNLAPISSGTAGYVLTSNGTATPSFQAAPVGSTSVYFHSYLSSTLSNVTGDGSGVAPVIFNTTTINNGSAYDATTGIFTAPTTGLYFFTANIFFKNVSTSNTYVLIAVYNSTANTYGARIEYNASTLNAVTDSGNLIISISGIQYATVGDEIFVELSMGGISKTVSVIGVAQTVTNFGGFSIGF